jgi:hypothetical protein
VAKYIKKPVVIEAYTWAEMLQLGRRWCTENGHALINSMPWHFEVNGYPLTHEDDARYTICTLEGDMTMTPEDMLIVGIKGEIYPCKRDIFEASYAACATER